MIANVVQSGHVILETTTSSSSSSYLSSSPFSSLLMFVLFYSLKTATALTNSVFQFQLFLVFNYTNCTLKYARFNDSVRSDAALRIIAQADTYIFISHLLTNANNGHWTLALSTYCHRVIYMQGTRY